MGTSLAAAVEGVNPSRTRYVGLALSIVLLTCSIGALIHGLDKWSAASSRHSRATSTLTAARARAAGAKTRADQAWKSRQHLLEKLRRQKSRLQRLQQAQATGFADAIAVGAARGRRSGEHAGVVEGRRDGRDQRGDIPGPGWYYVHVEWNGGLPIIAKSYTLKPGANHAYYVDGDTAYNRDTTSG